MHTFRRFALSVLGAVASVSTTFAKAPKGWETDFDTAMSIARKENKAVLVEFTGSDWCAPCIMMSKNVFSKEEFFDQVSPDFVMLYLDFPTSDPDLAAKNQEYFDKYGVEGFPSVVLLDQEGNVFDRFNATEFPETPLFVAHLKESLEKKNLD